MKRTLATAFALILSVAASANLASAAPTAVLHQSVIDSGLLTDGDGIHYYRTAGAIELDVSNQWYLWVMRTSGGNANQRMWRRMDNAVTVYNSSCHVVATPNWVSIMPWPDNTTLQFCRDSGGNVYGDQTQCYSFAGQYRPYGDGALPASQGGGIRNGVAFVESGTYNVFVLAVKTSSNGNNQSSNSCYNAGFGIGGPGVNGAMIIMQVTG